MNKLKNAKYEAEGVINIWESAEMGADRAKKKYKRELRKQRRVIENRLVNEIAREYIS